MEKQLDDARRAALAEFCAEEPLARDMMRLFGKRKYAVKESIVDNLVDDLHKAGVSASRAQIIRVLKALSRDEIGVGTFVVGRRKHKSRMVWSVPLPCLGEFANVAHDGGDLQEQTGRPAGGMLQHRFMLRPDLPVYLVLPVGLTGSEAKRLSDFVLSLPFAPG